MQLQQRHPATDFLELAQSRAPIQPVLRSGMMRAQSSQSASFKFTPAGV